MDWTNESGFTALLRAAEGGHTDIFQVGIPVGNDGLVRHGSAACNVQEPKALNLGHPSVALATRASLEVACRS